MMFTAVKNKKVYEQVVEQIQAMVMDGSLKGGDKLPNERELTATFGVSRASLREALRALEILGLLDCRQGEGNFISDNLDNAFYEPLSVMFKLRGGSLRDVVEARMALESEAAARAAERVTPEQSVALRRLVQDMVAAGTEEEAADLDQRFHRLMAEISGNALLAAFQHAASTLTAACIRDARKVIANNEAGRQELAAQHARIGEAVAAKDSAVAANLVRAHYRFVLEKLGL